MTLTHSSHTKRTLLFIAACVLCSYHSAAQNEFPAFPPEKVTNEMDYFQMLHQMGITLPQLPSKADDKNKPEGAVPQRADRPEGTYTYNGHNINRSPFGLWDNYDDTPEGMYPGRDAFRVGKYSPTNLLALNNGQKVTSAKEWQEKRRPEIAHDVQDALYGFFPSKERLPELTYSVNEYTVSLDKGSYVQSKIVGTIDVSSYRAIKHAPKISATLRLPADAVGTVPVMIIISWGDTMIDFYWPIFSQQGWGVCTFAPTAVQPDNGAGLTDYLIGLVNKGNWRKPDDWGSIGAWSWGISRLVDFLLADKRIDPNGIGLTGHSRYGKTALFAAAFDERISIVFPSDAGSLGTKKNKRHWGQDLENSASPSEYHWMAGNFFKWCGERTPGQYLPRKVEDCPVDASSLVALCAPRPVFFNAGSTSPWADPYGMYLTLREASPVYEFLGKKGVVMNDEKPLVDKAYLEGDLGYRCHNGGHVDTPDWPAFFEFAKKYIKF